MTSNDINDMMLYGERINVEYKEVTANMVDKDLLNQESKNRRTTYSINKEITPKNGSEV